jgi:hypothetical protein
MDDWRVVYYCGKQYRAEMVVGLLKENSIDAILLNKQDSLYLFGDVEVYVKPEDVIRAKHIIKTVIDFE